MITSRRSRARRKANIVFLFIALVVLFVYMFMFPLSCNDGLKPQDGSKLDVKTSYAYAGRVTDQVLVSEDTYYTHITGTLTEIIRIKTAEKEVQEKNLERKGSWSFDNQDLFLNCDIGDEVYIIIGDSGIRMIENWTTGWNVYYRRPVKKE